MKVFIFMHFVQLILTGNAIAVETVTNCESKVELRAVLLSCPVKDTSCDDDDPLSQAMAAEEAQIFQSNPKNYRSLKEEKERGYPNAVKDCKRKLIITLKVKNAGKIPCDDEYIVVDHVFDPLTGGRGRLLTPVVLKLRQEQMVQLYGLQFQRVVNSDPFEEEKDTENVCSVNPENPTCGIAMYDGKPIPFSEGFCCSCDPDLNTKRQLSTVSRGDSFLYRDSKLISQRNDRFSHAASSAGAIFNPSLVKLKGEDPDAFASSMKNTNAEEDDEHKESCPVRVLAYEHLPNFLMENDRKIVCDKDDFLSDLCQLRDEKNRLEQKDSIFLGGSTGNVVENGADGGGDSGRPALTAVKTFSEVTTTASQAVADRPRNEGPAPAGDRFNDAVILESLISALRMRQAAKGDTQYPFSMKSDRVNRGKRENVEEPATGRPRLGRKVTLDEKLNRFVQARRTLADGRRNRLLRVPRDRFRKTSTRYGGAEPSGELSRTSLPKFARDSCEKSSPPKYFFSHDKFIVEPGTGAQSLGNTSTGPLGGDDYSEGVASDLRRKYVQNLRKNEIEKKTAQEDADCERLGAKQKLTAGNAIEKVGRHEGNDALSSTGAKVTGENKDEGVLVRVKSSKVDGRKPLANGANDVVDAADEEGKGTGQPAEENVREVTPLSGSQIRNRLPFVKSRGRDKFLSQVNCVAGRPIPEAENNEATCRKYAKEGRSPEGKHYQEPALTPAKTANLASQNEKAKAMRQHVEGPSNASSENDRADSYVSDEGVTRLLAGRPLNVKIPEKPHAPDRGKEYLDGAGRAEMEPVRQWSYLPHRPPNGKSLESDNESGNQVDLNFEIIRKPIFPAVVPPVYTSKVQEYWRSGLEMPVRRRYPGVGLSPTVESELRKRAPFAKIRQRTHVPYETGQKYLLPAKEERDHGYFRDWYRSANEVAKPEAGMGLRRHAGLRDCESASAEVQINRAQPKHERRFHARKPPRQFYPSTAACNAHRKEPTRLTRTRHEFFLDGEKRNAEEVRRISNHFIEVARKDADAAKETRQKRNAVEVDAPRESTKKQFGDHTFEPARGFSKTALGLSASNGKTSLEIIGETGGCPCGRTCRISDPAADRCFMGFTNDTATVLTIPPFVSTSNGSTEAEFFGTASDRERLQRSYATAPAYVLRLAGKTPKGKRQASKAHEESATRTSSRCAKNAYDGEYTQQDTAHCMRFGDLWYSVYAIKKPVIAQIVGVQLFDKHGLCDGTTQWRDITKGKMVRIGTFLPKAEDDLPTISVTYMGGKTKKATTAIDPDNYLLLIPSHVTDPSKAGYYPQFDGGPREYLVVDSKYVSAGGDCDMIGTSFEAFARQPDRCVRPIGSCLRRQPVDLWREDMEARIRGKRGKYFVENFGTVPNSPIKTYTNFTGEYLALEYYGEYTSTIEIEVKADFNAMVRKGSNAQIPTVYIDGTYPKKTRIILSVLNIGLTSSYFRPRLGDCPPDLDPAWCPLEGPLVTIPPQQRHDFRLDLSGTLPPNKIHVTVQVLNQMNKKVAHRKIIIKKGDRCICAFHCKCNCIGNADGRSCHKLPLEEYRGAGYIGSYPFRGGSATSASESIRSNVRIIFLTAFYILLFMGVMKGVLGIFYRRMGIAGIKVISGPRKLCKYYEPELECCPVLFDECGFPIHPTTCRPVQIVPLWMEILINFVFFFIYPLRGIWFLLIALPCCTIAIEMCDSSSGNEGGASESDHKCSSPLLAKHPTSVHYTLTTFNSKQSKGVDEHPPYLPYKGDDDPLEEDDTEFVLQEMKRYRKKVTLL